MTWLSKQIILSVSDTVRISSLHFETMKEDESEQVACLSMSFLDRTIFTISEGEIWCG